MVTAIDSISIPCEYASLCGEWYSGQNDLLYAIASTGGLTLGNRRPSGCATDEQWYLTLWRELSVDVWRAVRSAKGHSDYATLTRFGGWVDGIVDSLEREYSLAEWERD